MMKYSMRASTVQGTSLRRQVPTASLEYTTCSLGHAYHCCKDMKMKYQRYRLIRRATRSSQLVAIKRVAYGQ